MGGTSAQEVSMVSPSVGRKKAKWSLWPRGQGLSSPGWAPSHLFLWVTLGGEWGHGQTLTELIEEEGVLVLLHVLRGARLIQKERVDPFDVVNLHFCALKGDCETSVGPLPVRWGKVGTLRPDCLGSNLASTTSWLWAQPLIPQFLYL